MSKAGALIWRKLFETGDARRLAKQVKSNMQDYGRSLV